MRDVIESGSTALQISNNLRTKLSLARNSRFVVTTIDSETAQYDVCVGVPACPSQIF
jgi:hypothetical protein